MILSEAPSDVTSSSTFPRLLLKRRCRSRNRARFLRLSDQPRALRSVCHRCYILLLAKTSDSHPSIGKSGTLLHSPIYSLIPHDLRDPFPEDLIDPTLPTLWIAECLLIYLEPTISECVVNWFSSHCRDWVGGICYEMYDLE